jgi:agmatine deiminase
MNLPAEWEKQEFVQIVFPHENTDWNDYLEESILTFVNIVNTISKYEKCLIIAKNLIYIKSLFKNKKNITFVKIDSDDTWSRDFGGITINDNNSLVVLDFNFNAWGKKFPYKLDDQITKQLKFKGLLKNYKYRSISFVLEGGAIESNGKGIILTTKQCLMEKNRNPKLTQNTIENKLVEYLGAKKVLWLNSGYLEGDDTDSHIDTLARFANEDTIVYQSCDDVNDVHYQPLLEMKVELANFTQLNGKKFNLIALPWIEAIYDENERLPASYANFLIINGAVLVPTYEDKNDEQALEIMKSIFPKRNIIGIDCQTLIRQHGSLHCVTMQYPSIGK